MRVYHGTCFPYLPKDPDEYLRWVVQGYCQEYAYKSFSFILNLYS